MLEVITPPPTLPPSDSPQHPALGLARIRLTPREIRRASDRSVLRCDEVLSAGSLISSDTANAPCQKRSRLTPDSSPVGEKAKSRAGVER